MARNLDTKTEQLLLTEKDQARILVYRKRFNLDTEKVSDQEVFKLIENFRWLARLYIDEFRNKEPKSILQKLKISYNNNADKSKDDSLRS